MGLLDYADTARKKLAGLLGEIPLVQMAQGRAEMPTMGGLLASLKSMPVFSPDAGQSAYEAALNIGPMGLGKIVYHGSPHKFDKFDASKIGTGEGAQAYGHGVYLADSKGVAADYRNKLTADRSVELDAFDHENGYGAKDPTTGQMKWFGNEKEAKDFKRDAMGSLYKADLPDEWIPKMLDWDKPVKTDRLQGGSGGQVWRNLVNGLGDEQAAADYLKSLGIPGIRYLDGGSRGRGQGSYNYVVFPGLEDQVKILERNGVPLSGLLGGQ